ncbi:MAG: hypothetical protein WCR42_04345 [bacterium]
MKTIKIILILATIVIAGCQNPMDVTDDIDKEKIGNKPMDYYFSVDSVLYESVYPDSTKVLDLLILNKLKTDLAINTIVPKWGTAFTVQDFIPGTLKPIFTNGDNIPFKVKFFSSESGEFFDTLFVNGKDYPYLYLKAIVHDAYAFDVNFDTLDLSILETATRKLYLCNNTTHLIKLKSFQFSNPDFDFAEDFDLPLDIPPKSQIIKYVLFSPKQHNYFNPTLKLRFTNAYYPDSVVALKSHIK